MPAQDAPAVSATTSSPRDAQHHLKDVEQKTSQHLRHVLLEEWRRHRPPSRIRRREVNWDSFRKLLLQGLSTQAFVRRCVARISSAHRLAIEAQLARRCAIRLVRDVAEGWGLHVVESASLEDAIKIGMAEEQQAFFMTDLFEAGRRANEARLSMPRGMSLAHRAAINADPVLIDLFKKSGVAICTDGVGGVAAAAAVCKGAQSLCGVGPIRSRKVLAEELRSSPRWLSVDTAAEVRRISFVARQLMVPVPGLVLRLRGDAACEDGAFGVEVERGAMSALLEAANKENGRIVGVLVDATTLGAVGAEAPALEVMERALGLGGAALDLAVELGCREPTDGFLLHLERVEEACGTPLDSIAMDSARRAWRQGVQGFRTLQIEASGFLCGAAVALAARVVGHKVVGKAGEGTATHVFIDEGFYGGLSAAQPPTSVLRIAVPGGRLLEDGASESARTGAGVVWGPTCDSMDVVLEAVEINERQLEEGWLHWHHVGATGCHAARSRFNGFGKTGQRYSSSATSP